jgi:hypothetical protein
MGNMSLFASRDVILKMKSFLIAPNLETLSKTTISMRNDLYGLSDRLKPMDLIFDPD